MDRFVPSFLPVTCAPTYYQCYNPFMNAVMGHRFSQSDTVQTHNKLNTSCRAVIKDRNLQHLLWLRSLHVTSDQRGKL